MIYYFSATGNCKYAAERIAAAIGDTTASIVDADTYVKLSEGEAFGIVCPTYFWELPVPVRKFLSGITINGDGKNYIFFVATCGMTPGCCGEDARRILSKRCVALDASFSVKMPDTWTPIFDLSNTAKVAKQNQNAENNIENVISRIHERQRGNRTERRTPYAVRHITDPIMNSKRKTKNFYVENTCIGCGLCAKKCPVHAIEMQSGKPVWVKERCALCLGCLHHCPKFAIQYGNGKTKSHGQYKNPNTEI